MQDQADTWVGRRVQIRGHVQGVGFRWNMTQTARDLGVSGWVRNRLDGSVEAMIGGPNSAVAQLILWAGHGPGGARVESVEVEVSSERWEGFSQAATI